MARRAALLAALTLVAAACTDVSDLRPSPGATSATGPPTASPSPSPAPRELVVWAGAALAPALDELAGGFDAGVPVSVVEVAPEEMAALLAGEAGVGVTPGTEGAAGGSPEPAPPAPDLVLGSHELLWPLLAEDLLAPVDDPVEGPGFPEVAVQALSRDGVPYGVPFGLEAVALIRNTDLVPEAPATFEDLERIALDLEAKGEVDLALGMPAPDPYHQYPLYAALGGYVFGTEPDGDYLASDLGLDAAEALGAAGEFGAWAAAGLLEPDASYETVTESFLDGRVAFAVTGPWALSDPDLALDAGRVPFAVEPLPPLDGVAPRPFVRVQAAALLAAADDAEAARAFLRDVVAAPEGQARLAEALALPPALAEAEPADPALAGFGASALAGDPLPGLPEMLSVWGPWADAYAQVLSRTADPAAAFRGAAAQIRAAIAAG